jgi:hypothetical protein
LRGKLIRRSIEHKFECDVAPITTGELQTATPVAERFDGPTGLVGPY